MSKADLIDIIETQKTVINDLQWHDEIMSNTDLPIAARFAARAVRKFTQTRKPCDDGYFKGYLPAMAELAGVSAPTISRGLQTLSDATEAIDKHTDEIRDERGRLEKNLLYFRTYESFNAAAEITPTKELPKHGGNRRLPCPECGCVHRRRKVLEECAACSHKFYENERIIRGDEEPFQVETAESSEETPDELEPFQVETLPVDTLVCIASCNVAEELKAYPNFVDWCYKGKPNKKGKIPKVPHDPKVTDRAKQAMPNNPETWGTYEQAEALRKDFDGIGFVFSEHDPYAGIDLDQCRDPETGTYNDQAQEMMRTFQTRWEISPSGKGIKGIMKGSIPHGINRQGIELYSSDHFFTLTGQHVAGTPETIADCNTALNDLYKKLAPEEFESPNHRRVDDFTCSRSDEEILERAKTARDGSGETFWRLYNGIIPNYPSQSEADLALCGMLAYWTNNNVFTIDRLFRQSRLMRDKWDEKHGWYTYGELTIMKAVGQLPQRRAS